MGRPKTCSSIFANLLFLTTWHGFFQQILSNSAIFEPLTCFSFNICSNFLTDQLFFEPLTWVSKKCRCHGVLSQSRTPFPASTLPKFAKVKNQQCFTHHNGAIFCKSSLLLRFHPLNSLPLSISRHFSPVLHC